MAPWAAGIVKELRAEFGEVQVLMVSEGELHFDRRRDGQA